MLKRLLLLLTITNGIGQIFFEQESGGEATPSDSEDKK